MRRTPKQQQAGITRLNNAFGGIVTITSMERKRNIRRYRKRLRRKAALKHGDG